MNPRLAAIRRIFDEAHHRDISEMQRWRPWGINRAQPAVVIGVGMAGALGAHYADTLLRLFDNRIKAAIYLGAYYLMRPWLRFQLRKKRHGVGYSDVNKE